MDGQSEQGTKPRLTKEEKAAEKARKKREKQEKQRRLLFKPTKDGRRVSRLMNFLRVLLYPIHFIIFPFRLHGCTKVGRGAYIYVGNHYSIFDIFFPAHTTWEGIHFLAKDSVFQAPVLG